MSQNKPIYSIREGILDLAVWPAAKPFGSRNVTLRRRLRGPDDTWVNSPTLTEFDLSLAVRLLLDAHTWLRTHRTPEEELLQLPAAPDEASTESSDADSCENFEPV